MIKNLVLVLIAALAIVLSACQASPSTQTVSVSGNTTTITIERSAGGDPETLFPRTQVGDVGILVDYRLGIWEFGLGTPSMGTGSDIRTGYCDTPATLKNVTATMVCNDDTIVVTVVQN